MVAQGFESKCPKTNPYMQEFIKTLLPYHLLVSSQVQRTWREDITQGLSFGGMVHLRPPV